MKISDQYENVFLVGDIGGTHIRFACFDMSKTSVQILTPLSFYCADFDTIEQAIRHYLDHVDMHFPAAICLAAAGNINKGKVQMTNNSWFVDEDYLSLQFGGIDVRLVNDFAAIAQSVSVLAVGDYQIVGEGFSRFDNTSPSFTVGVLGSGTGLGVAGLVQTEQQLLVLPSEAGHSGFAPETEIQIELLRKLRERFSRVSNERLLSGGGLENIYWALSELNEIPYVSMSAKEIFQNAQLSKRHLAYQSVQLFFEILGQVAGDLALTLRATEGIFISGGITKRYPELLSESRFREAFESKGRYRQYLETVPTYLLMHDYPGLLGACLCLKR